MKILKFEKMAGAGNDFIMIVAQKGLNYKLLAPRVCDRTNGIGADGLIVLDRSTKADYKMRIINADGSEAEMCGNGARCLAAYILKHRKPRKKRFSIETLAGIIYAEGKGELVTVRLSDPVGYQADIPISVNGRNIHVHYIDTGVPHVIVNVLGLDTVAVSQIGRTIRYHKRFQPRGANVNFVEQIDKNFVDARTYERGVEDETKACGTGSVASALVSYLKTNPGINNIKKARVKVKTKSGEVLNVTFDIQDGKVTEVWLKGSAKFIAKGEYYVRSK